LSTINEVLHEVGNVVIGCWIWPFVTIGTGLAQPNIDNWTLDGIEPSLVAKIEISRFWISSSYGT
jgi:hypothetical protein